MNTSNSFNRFGQMFQAPAFVIIQLLTQKEIAYRLIRMFSFAGDLVLDPFVGTGTTIIAAIEAGRNSLGVEIDPSYLNMAKKHIENLTNQIWGTASLQLENWLDEDQSANQPGGCAGSDKSE